MSPESEKPKQEPRDPIFIGAEAGGAGRPGGRGRRDARPARPVPRDGRRGPRRRLLSNSRGKAPQNGIFPPGAPARDQAAASARRGFVKASAATSKNSRLAPFSLRKARCFSELNQASAVSRSSK